MRSYPQTSQVAMFYCLIQFLLQVWNSNPNSVLPLRTVLSHIYAWSGNSAVKAINLLLSKGVVESNIIFLNLIAVSHSDACFSQKIQLHNLLFYHNSMSFMQAPQGIHMVCKKFPKLKIVTSEIDVTLDEDLRVIPGMGEFGDRYFGTNN